MSRLNWLHNSLLEGSQTALPQHMAMFGMTGAVLGGGNSFINNTSMLDGTASGAFMGVGLAAGFKYAANKYSVGAINHINRSTNANGEIFAGTRRNLSHQGNFRLSNFTEPNADNLDFHMWHSNVTPFQTARFQHYDASFNTKNSNPAYVGSKWGKISEGIEEYT